MNVPLVNLKANQGPIHAQAIPEVRAALDSVGFMAVDGHGVPQATIDHALEAARVLFTSDREVREEVYAREDDPLFRGFLEPTPGVHEQYMMNRISGEMSELRCADARVRGTNQWPEVPNFRERLMAYYDAAHTMAMTLMAHVATSFSLAPDWFDGMFSRHMTPLTLNYYRANSVQCDHSLRNEAHRDWSALTVLYQDEGAGGLQIEVNGEWVDVPYRHGSFIVNVGRLMSIWTNDHLRPGLHRVRSAASDGASGDRVSIAYFLHPNPDAIVECLPTIKSRETPRYRPVRSDLYFIDSAVRKSARIID